MSQEKRPRDTNQLAKSIMDIAIGRRKMNNQKTIKILTLLHLEDLAGLKAGKPGQKSYLQRKDRRLLKKAQTQDGAIKRINSP